MVLNMAYNDDFTGETIKEKQAADMEWNWFSPLVYVCFQCLSIIW